MAAITPEILSSLGAPGEHIGGLVESLEALNVVINAAVAQSKGESE